MAVPRFVAPEPYYEERPWFFSLLHNRNLRHKNSIGCSTGQLGEGKSYWFMWVFWTLSKKWPDLYAPFTLDNVVFTPEQFWKVVDTSPSDLWVQILWDDPTKGLSHRDWYMDLNKTVTTFIMTSSRYKKKNLGFALPAFELLDKNVRAVTSFEGILQEHPVGMAKVHGIKVNRFGTPPLWKPFWGEVQSKIPPFAKDYEEKRNEFTKKAYQEREFTDETEDKGTRVFRRVYLRVKEDLKPYYSTKLGKEKKLDPLTVAALCECSDKTARLVIRRIELDLTVPPLAYPVDSPS